jgi:hypothetical protein
MQIDFHHAVTYVAARCAGFDDPQAATIAYAAQYVDDATCDGTIHFTNRALYTRISSAHKSVDPENLQDVENHLVWLPFHFLPGNGGQPAGNDPKGTFIDKILCRPGDVSPIAQEMVEAVLGKQGGPRDLHRLGITMHIYADTWAHQGFAGVLHQVNEVDDIDDTTHSGVFNTSWISDLLDDMVPPLGHGRARVFPDMPFLAWAYKNGRGETIQRDNTGDFLKAAGELCKVMQRYRQRQDPSVKITGLPPQDLQKIRELFTRPETRIQDPGKRHKVWLEAIASGAFSFGKAVLSYDEEAWKAQALGTRQDSPEFTYTPEFLGSDWKHFHDALQEHRLTLLHDILPKYGICAG